MDVVQTRGRRAQSKSNLLLSEREASNGTAEFYRVVGEYPQDLKVPKAVNGLPATLEEAMMLAQRNNPGIKAAESELAQLKRAGSRLKVLQDDLELGATRNNDTDGSITNDDESAVIQWPTIYTRVCRPGAS